MSRKWNIPLTYAPKIQPVIDGTCRQTIRTGRKFSVGDLIRFYTWAGRPYHSKRTTITEYMQIVELEGVVIIPEGLVRAGYLLHNWPDMDILAYLDGIVPPTGAALKEVLMSKNKIPVTGIDAQIVRW